jgi:hypothetical protein
MLTVEVAAQRTDRKTKRAGVKVEEGLFFYGVGGSGRNEGIVQVIEDAALIPLHPADAVLALIDTAAPLAGAAPDSGIRQLFEKHSLMHNPSSPQLR